MSGRQYDQSGKATCNVCGADCWLSNERNFNGARCKNIMCNSHDVTYDMDVPLTSSTFTTITKEHIIIEDETDENIQLIPGILSGDNDIKININYTDRDIDTETKFGSDAMEMKKNLYKNNKDKEK